MGITRKVFALVPAFAVFAAFATGEISNVRVEGGTGMVTVTYALSEDAVVTPRFYAGGAWIADDRVTVLEGDVCRLVRATTGDERRSFVWRPSKENIPDAERGIFTDAKVELTAWALKSPPAYMVADLAGGDAVRYYASAESVPGTITNDVYKLTKLLFFKVPAKHVEWYMGSPETEGDRVANEVRHKVVLSDDYYLGVYPVTQNQAGIVNPGHPCRDPRFIGRAESPLCPTCGYGYNVVRGEGVSPGDKPAAGSHLDLFRQATGVDVDLPTEAQWEYAMRAGTTGPYSYGSYPATLEYSWNAKNSDYGDGDGKLTRPVGKGCNGWKLYDMAGNVWEMCRDNFGNYVFDNPETPVIDPVVTVEGATKCSARGASYSSEPVYSRSAYRYVSASFNSTGWDLGYRLAAPAEAR